MKMLLMAIDNSPVAEKVIAMLYRSRLFSLQPAYRN